MADDAATQAAGTITTQAEFAKNPRELVKNWMAAIKLAEAEEKDWRDDAKESMEVYRAEQKGRSKYNILFANEQTIMPALYNSEPSPDIRKRFGDGPPAAPTQPGPMGAAPAGPPADPAKQASQALERGLSIQAELYGFDGCMKAAVMDMRLAGRGVTRVRVVAGPNGSKRFTCEEVKWDDFRRGPATTWSLVPWVAFFHRMTKEEVAAIATAEGGAGREVADKVPLDLEIGADNDKEKTKADVPDIFKRAQVWEIWDRATGKVYWIGATYEDGPIAVNEDPYDLRGFFPCPKPLYAIARTDSLAPVCPFRIWKHLADEMNTVTARISAIVAVMKLRGLYDGAFEGAISRLENANDGELMPIEDAARVLQQGGLDKGIWIWPIEKVIAVVEGLYEARERCKQTIYEITGVADILRGQTDPDETLGAQQIKAQWGSLRLQDAQREVQIYARDLYRMLADLMAKFWEGPEWAAATNIQLMPETLELLKADLQREFSIEIETDSTIQADQGRAQQNIGLFIQGLGSFTESVEPIVQAGLMPAPVAVKLIGSFARVFKLGREAEDTIEEWSKFIEQQAQQPQQQREDPKVQAERVKAEAAQQKAQADVQMVQVKAQAQAQQTQMDMQAKAAELNMQMQKLQAELQAFMVEHQANMQARQQDAVLQERQHQMHAHEQMMGQEHAERGHEIAMEGLEAKRRMQQERPNGGAA